MVGASETLIVKGIKNENPTTFIFELSVHRRCDVCPLAVHYPEVLNGNHAQNACMLSAGICQGEAKVVGASETLIVKRSSL